MLFRFFSFSAIIAAASAPLEAAPLVLFDLSNTARTGNVTHIYIQSNGLNSTCNLYQLPQASSQGQLFPASFLQQNAIYASQETVNGIAFIYITDKWAVIIGNTIVSFYFDKNGNWVRLDEISQGYKTSVVTWIYNLHKKAVFDKSVFNINGCAK